MTEAVPLVEAAGVDVGVVHDDVQFEGTTRVYLGPRAVQQCRSDAARPEVWTDVEILEVGQGTVPICGGTQRERSDADVVPSRIGRGDDDEDVIPVQEAFNPRYVPVGIGPRALELGVEIVQKPRD